MENSSLVENTKCDSSVKGTLNPLLRCWWPRKYTLSNHLFAFKEAHRKSNFPDREDRVLTAEAAGVDDTHLSSLLHEAL